jgi:hypothetical protein
MALNATEGNRSLYDRDECFANLHSINFGSLVTTRRVSVYERPPAWLNHPDQSTRWRARSSRPERSRYTRWTHKTPESTWAMRAMV